MVPAILGGAGGGVGRVSTISVCCQQDSPSSGTTSVIQRSAVNLKSNATEHEAVLEGEAERCHSSRHSVQSLNNFTISWKSVVFKNEAHGFYSIKMRRVTKRNSCHATTIQIFLDEIQSG